MRVLPDHLFSTLADRRMDVLACTAYAPDGNGGAAAADGTAAAAAAAAADGAALPCVAPSAEAEHVDALGRMVVAQVQAIPGITRTLTCPVVRL